MVAGRKVRCARCKVDWFPVPHEAAAADPPESAAARDGASGPGDAGARDQGPPAALTMPPDHSAMDRLAMRSAPVPTPRTLLAAWSASIVVLVLLVSGTIVWRDGIVHAWPASARVLGVLGIAAEARPPAK